MKAKNERRQTINNKPFVSVAFGSPPPPKEGPALKKGVKKKDLRSLPKFTAIDESVVKFSNFAICLSEFAVDDEI